MIKKSKHIAFIFLLIILVSPLFFEIFSFIHIKSLKGYFQEISDSNLTIQNWNSGVYQNQHEKVFQQKLRIRPVLVRINNQIRFLIQKDVSAANVVYGKNGYFFERHYIWTYYGLDFKGADSIRTKMNDLKTVIDFLETKNIKFLLVLAPGKAEFMPENIPDEFNNDKKKTNNYQIYKQLCSKLNISYIDFNSYFRQMKDTIHYPLYTKGGTHWSIYGSYLAIDTIIKKIEHLLQKDLPDYNYPLYQVTKKMRRSDHDIANAANLLWYKHNQVVLYPYLQISDTNQKFKPNIAVIADSYYWTIVNNGIQRLFFNNFSFWYYFKENHTSKPDSPKMLSEIPDLKSEIESKDILVFLITDGNLREFSWGFTEKIKELYNLD